MQSLELNKQGNIELSPEKVYELLKAVWLEGHTDCQIENSLNVDHSKAEDSWLESMSKNQVLCMDYNIRKQKP